MEVTNDRCAVRHMRIGPHAYLPAISNFNFASLWEEEEVFKDLECMQNI